MRSEAHAMDRQLFKLPQGNPGDAGEGRAWSIRRLRPSIAGLFDTQNFNNHALRPLSVELGIENSLPRADVLDQTALMVVYIDGSGDVHGGDKAETVLHLAGAHNLFYLISDVHHFLALPGFKNKIFRVTFHRRLSNQNKGMTLPALPHLIDGMKGYEE
jgi:hypothetical protein